MNSLIFHTSIELYKNINMETSFSHHTFMGDAGAEKRTNWKLQVQHESEQAELTLQSCDLKESSCSMMERLSHCMSFCHTSKLVMNRTILCSGKK